MQRAFWRPRSVLLKMSCKGFYHKRRLFEHNSSMYARVQAPASSATLLYALREAGLPRVLILLIIGIWFEQVDSEGRLVSSRFERSFSFRCRCNERYGRLALYY